ncbi:MAG: response regulator [Nitrospirae bacterium]|nr:response regulator [Nitrospirota bacterium]
MTRSGTMPKAPDGLRPIRVFVADDSFAYRTFLRELIGTQPDMQVVGEAGNGYNAAQRVAALVPDVVVLDLRMPGLDGRAALRRMVQGGVPSRVIIVSAYDDALAEFDGRPGEVVTVLKKGGDGDRSWNDTLIANIRAVGGGRRRTPVGAPAGLAAMACPVPEPVAAPRPESPRALLVGASTGGPQAVVALLKQLPQPLPIPTLIVIHVGERLADAMADWLARETGKPVRLARHGEPLAEAAGQFLLAPNDHHMTVRGGRVVLTQDAPMHGMRPAVDVLFHGAARALGGAAIGVLLTGMGKDGAEGLLALRQAGAPTLVQDEASATVYGMPGHAVHIGAAARVLPLQRIARAVSEELGHSGG